MASIIHAVGHGLSAGDAFYFANTLPTDCGVSYDTLYYVLAAGLTADQFQFSDTDGGTPFVLDTAITETDLIGPDVYEPDETSVMAAPYTVAVEPPSAPATDSEVIIDPATGTPLIRLNITWTPPTEDRTKVVFVQVTFVDDGDPISPQPVWDERAALFTVAPDQTSLSIDGVAGDTPYYVRVWAEDVFHNASTMVEATAHQSAKDSIAPDYPGGLTCVPDFKSLWVKWNPTTAKDLAFFEVRYAPDDGTGLAPDTNQWVTVRSKTTAVYIGGLTADSNADGIADKRYWVQARAVDISGNVVTSTSDPTAVDYLAYPDAGWADAVSGNPTLTSGADISFGAITDDHIVTTGLSAGVIKTGDLRVQTSDADMIDGIKVYDGATLVGKWDETGLYVYSSTDATDYVRLFEGGVSVFIDGVESAALTTDGINASVINFGSLPGGHNLVENSSFELSDFAAAPTTVTWTALADWSGTKIAETNITEGAGALTMTASSY